MKKYIGITGLAVGSVAIAVAIFQDNLRTAAGSPPKPDPTLKELAAGAGMKLIKEKILKEKGFSSELVV